MTEKVREQLSRGRQKVVTPLGKLLMEASMEDLLAFLQRLGIQYSLSGNIRNHHGRKDPSQGYFRCKLFFQVVHESGNQETVERYEGVSARSVKGALAAALARFLVCENHDHHDYRGLAPAKEVDETLV